MAQFSFALEHGGGFLSFHHNGPFKIVSLVLGKLTGVRSSRQITKSASRRSDCFFCFEGGRRNGQIGFPLKCCPVQTSLTKERPLESGSVMEEIKAKHYSREVVCLDGKLFSACEFEDCLLTYGGGPCEWDSTRFSNCRVLLDGAANNTVQVLQGLGFKVTPPDAEHTPGRGQTSLRIH